MRVRDAGAEGGENNRAEGGEDDRVREDDDIPILSKPSPKRWRTTCR